MLLLASGGMSLADGWHYIAGPNREIVSGYSEAMALYFRANNWQQWPYWLCSAGAIAMAVIGLRRRWQWRQPLGTAALVLGGLLFFWAPFKAGMVRHDIGHFPMAGLYLLSGGLLIAMLFWRDLGLRPSWLNTALLVPAAGGLWISNPGLDWDLQLSKALRQRGLDLFWQASTSQEGRQRLRAHRHGVIEQIRSRDDVHERLPIPAGASADHLPWETMDVVSNGLRYTPRPIPHSLNAYSQGLLELNRAFFADPKRRPEYVVLSSNSIDQRWPSIDIEGPGLSEIAKHYSLVGRGSKGSLVLRTDPGVQPLSERILLSAIL